MWKVSFDKNTYKKVERFNDRVTVVTLKGTLKVPENWLLSLPKEVCTWLSSKKSNPKVQYNMLHDVIYITVKGKAIRRNEDKDNPVLAERIAECRARMIIYKFVYSLLNKYIKYYVKTLFGKNADTPISMYLETSLTDIKIKYYDLWENEYVYLEKLVKESNNV